MVPEVQGVREGSWVPKEVVRYWTCATMCCRANSRALAQLPEEKFPWLPLLLGVAVGAAVGVSIYAVSK